LDGRLTALRVLVINAGSSTLKASVLDPPRRESHASEIVDWGTDATRATDRRGAFGELLSALVVAGVPIGSIDAVGHRVVHGGTRFVAPAIVDDDVLAGIEVVAPLAPLHNAIAIETIRLAAEALPAVPHVACFDTAFHRTLDQAALRYRLPERWYEEWGVRRFGFHGLSVAWSARRAAELLDRDPADLAMVVAHLGSGCSVTAVDGGRSVATSMGMTPLEGLMMGSRAGSIDPGVLLALLRDGHRTPDELAEDLDHGSGLVGVAGTSDVRALLAAEAAGDERAVLGLELFVRRAAAGIAAAATELPRLDAVVFTGGIGEHAGPLRARIVARLGMLGLGSIPPAAVDHDAVLSTGGAPPAVLRIEAREDVVVAEATAELAAAASSM
jgi:acetate kinase